MSNKIHFEDIENIIIETLNLGKTFKIQPNGSSMLPLIVQGRDSVYIKKPDGQLKKYDIAFYKRSNGQFVLHRVVKAKKDSYIMCGDNQYIDEKNIYDKNIIGVVSKLEIDGKTILPDDLSYRKYVVWRVNTRHFRKLKAWFLSPIYRVLSKIKSNFKK